MTPSAAHPVPSPRMNLNRKPRERESWSPSPEDTASCALTAISPESHAQICLLASLLPRTDPECVFTSCFETCSIDQNPSLTLVPALSPRPRCWLADIPGLPELLKGIGSRAPGCGLSPPGVIPNWLPCSSVHAPGPTPSTTYLPAWTTCQHSLPSASSLLSYPLVGRPQFVPYSGMTQKYSPKYTSSSISRIPE